VRAVDLFWEAFWVVRVWMRLSCSVECFGPCQLPTVLIARGVLRDDG
jgi:hypothetical protein